MRVLTSRLTGILQSMPPSPRGQANGPFLGPALLTWAFDRVTWACSFSTCFFSSSFSSFMRSRSLRSLWKSSSKIFTCRGEEGRGKG